MSTSRRDFLKTLGGMALLTIVPRQVLGGPKFTAPSDQLTKGIIGVGGIGKSSYHFTSNKDCRLVAVCDVDRKHLESAVALGQKKFGETLDIFFQGCGRNRPDSVRRQFYPAARVLCP